MTTAMATIFSESGETDSAGITLTASQMIEYLYCPRFTYFEYVLGIPQNEAKRFKVEKGRGVHETMKNRNPDYLRKRIGVISRESDVFLASSQGIRGIVDEILFLNDGTAAPLDYKYAEFKNDVFNTYRLQMVFYARLIKDNYNVPVNRSYIVYTRSKNKLVEVKIGDEEYEDLKKTIGEMLLIIQKNKYPKPTRSTKRCTDCCYKNICEKTV